VHRKPAKIVSIELIRGPLQSLGLSPSDACLLIKYKIEVAIATNINPIEKNS
tara:strand:- start:217 stop:372 length:156 start_codon:yes stop_codon:yes gene_type:complete